MGANECCVDGRRPNGASQAETASPTKKKPVRRFDDYENWQPSWQLDGEEDNDYKESRHGPQTKSRPAPTPKGALPMSAEDKERSRPDKPPSAAAVEEEETHTEIRRHEEPKREKKAERPEKSRAKSPAKDGTEEADEKPPQSAKPAADKPLEPPKRDSHSKVDNTDKKKKKQQRYGRDEDEENKNEEDDYSHIAYGSEGRKPVPVLKPAAEEKTAASPHRKAPDNSKKSSARPAIVPVTVKRAEEDKSEPKHKAPSSPHKASPSVPTAAAHRDFTDMMGKSLVRELTKARAATRTQAGTNAMPYLVVPSLYMENYALVFCKDAAASGLIKGAVELKGHSLETMLEKYCITDLTLSDLDEDAVSAQVTEYLQAETAKGNKLVGCVGDRTQSTRFHFCFLKTGTASPKRFGCVGLGLGTGQEMRVRLEKLLKSRKEFRLGLPLFDPTFSRLLGQFAIYEEVEHGGRGGYQLAEFPDLDFLNAEIAGHEKRGEGFCGVLAGTSFEDSFILFTSE